MASIYIFCERDELRVWIADLCQKYHLGILYFGNEEGGRVVSPNQSWLTEDVYQVFLFPSSTFISNGFKMNDVRQRDWGWINIRPGGFTIYENQAYLLLTDINGEKCESGAFTPTKVVLWLKRKLKKEIYSGVTGKNVVYGGTRFYKDIFYTEKAANKLNNGILWKQFRDDNSIFTPNN